MIEELFDEFIMIICSQSEHIPMESIGMCSL